MTHAAKVIADSVSPDGVRLTTFEVVFPRIVLSEFNTHRMFSRNSASSRAIPVEKMIKMVLENPYVPTHWGKNQRGMQAEEELSEGEQSAAKMLWSEARSKAVTQARALLNLGVHKQITNRLLEPFMWHTVICSATEWDNFFHLRMHPAAHPEIRKVAEFMHNVMQRSEPTKLNYGQWHLPLVDPIMENVEPDKTESHWSYWSKVSVGRCARVSYLTHDGRRDPAEDIALCDRLLTAGHLSPFEHVARPMTLDDLWDRRFLLTEPSVEDGRVQDTLLGNLRGWVQFRKMLPHEHDVLGGGVKEAIEKARRS